MGGSASQWQSASGDVSAEHLVVLPEPESVEAPALPVSDVEPKLADEDGWTPIGESSELFERTVNIESEIVLVPEPRTVSLPLCERLRFGLMTDLRESPGAFVSDTKSFFRPWTVIGHLLIPAGATAIVANNWDDNVRRSTAGHPRRWGSFNNVLDVVGHPGTHLGATGVFYFTSLATEDERARDFSHALLNSLLLTDGTVLGLKYAFDTTRPNGRSRGFPSGHVASSFAVAAVIDEYYGESFHGIPAFAADVGACFVAWHRIDDRDHDLSDVIFGAALGSVIGEVVAKNHLLEEKNIKVHPHVDPEQGTTGVLIEHSY